MNIMKGTTYEKKENINYCINNYVCFYMCRFGNIYPVHQFSVCNRKKLMTSVKEKDIDSFIECIEPETAQKIQWLIDV